MKIFSVFLVTFFVLLATITRAEEDADDGSTNEESNEETEEDNTSGDDGDGKEEDEIEEDGESPYKQFVCNLQYKRIGCYASADEEKDKKPLKKSAVILKEQPTDLEKFNDQLPRRACQCANEALTSGNALFGLMNYSECWSGPDDSSYDREGPSNECVTFDLAPCEPANEVCTGKELANFMYYIDTPEHNKTPDEVQKELEEERGKLEDPKKKKKSKGKEHKGKNTKTTS